MFYDIRANLTSHNDNLYKPKLHLKYLQIENNRIVDYQCYTNGIKVKVSKKDAIIHRFADDLSKFTPDTEIVRYLKSIVVGTYELPPSAEPSINPI